MRARGHEARLPGETWAPGEPLRDVAESWPVRRSQRPYAGFVSVREDEVESPDAESFARVVVEHPGAVGVLAVDTADDSDDEDPRVLLLRQYRHAVGHRLLEIPAGLLDVAGEAPADAAARELAEEASLRAESWSLLLSGWATPGISDEHWHVYVATGLTAVPAEERGERRHEEADMTAVWVPLSAAVDAALHGRLGDAMAMAGVLALHARRQRPGPSGQD